LIRKLGVGVVELEGTELLFGQPSAPSAPLAPEEHPVVDVAVGVVEGVVSAAARTTMALEKMTRMSKRKAVVVPHKVLNRKIAEK
jgi:hypothetical protein